MNAKTQKEAEDKWNKVEKLIDEKNSAVRYLTMGELLLEAVGPNDYENRAKTLAKKAIRKEKRYEFKIQMLIDAEAWTEAIEETFSNKKHAEFDMFLDKIRQKGPPFVEDFIKEQSQKKK